MIKKLLSFFLVSLFLISGFINYKVFRSLIDQALLIYEFNAFQLNVPYEIVEPMDVDFPNITVTTLPMKALKGRYLMRDSVSSQALELLYQSRKDNPFLGIGEFELSKYHLNKKNLDSALFYSKIAFQALPNNPLMSRIHFEVLTRMKKDSLLDVSFHQIKDNFIFEQWADYLFCKLEIGKTPRKELALILNSVKKTMPGNNQFSTLNTLINIGSENLNDFSRMIIEAETLYSKEKFNEAANLYEASAMKDPTEFTHFENAALSYYRGNSIEDAKRLFRYTMRTFNPKKGKSEFYYGLLLYEEDKKEEACKFWAIAREKNFAGSQRVIDSFCK